VSPLVSTPTASPSSHTPGATVQHHTAVLDRPAIDLDEVVQAACDRIAPVWPLDRFVAVNPYLGLRDMTFAEAAERLASTAGARATLPVQTYLDAVADGRITPADLAAALGAHGRPVDVDAFLDRVHGSVGADDTAWATRVPTVARIAAFETGTDWTRFTTDRVSAFAAAYFDNGQTMWRSAPKSAALYEAWKDEASVDRSPEVMGLRGFRATVRSLPDDAETCIRLAVEELGVPAESLEVYLHAVLLGLAGWSAHARRIGWDAGLRGEDDDTLVQLLAVLLGWEVGLHRSLGGNVDTAWQAAIADLAGGDLGTRSDVTDRIVLQEAFDRAEQRRLAARFADAPAGGHAGPAAAQAVFCIDVRSEVFRRHLETSGRVDTIGFAGFFGFPIEFLPLAHATGEAQCPVLLSPACSVPEIVDDTERTSDAAEHRRLLHHVRRAWKSFKMGAISCFSFVGPVGLLYLPKLFTDSAGTTRPAMHPDSEALPGWARIDRAPDTTVVPLDTRVQLAEGALRAMSLTSGFAPLVLVAGHGASTVNNPYDAGLACGACGGHTGEANARVAVAILNDAEVRAALVQRGITIPDGTWFVAAQHDTTTDAVSIFDRSTVPATHTTALEALESALVAAGRGARAERAGRLGITAGTDADEIDVAVLRRSTDWAQVRPEWGLAGCRAFVVAPRHRTAGLDLGGRAFLHSYDWRQDDGFGVLELIMTAPMVVASWINLQYYASTVENRLFGSGNKTLHNVVSRLGVLEGNGGDLRTGLPWQSVHDGDELQHEPYRLAVVIEAPIEAMNDVLRAHPDVQELCDHGWVHLLAMDGEGHVSHRYAGGLAWQPMSS
jgi:uncharacterized protein